tara:strand:+ start:876 stop:1070 length:195 start_codon:yes stop_codon:yes gene_type:complete
MAKEETTDNNDIAFRNSVIARLSGLEKISASDNKVKALAAKKKKTQKKKPLKGLKGFMGFKDTL